MANRQYKDSVFRTYFNCAERLAALYRAIRQDETIRPEDIRITTLDDVFLSRLKNDVSFLWKDQAIILAEHQSSINPNMPYRCYLYSAMLMMNMVGNKNALYGKELVKLPAPHCYVFYIGDDMKEDEKILRLSDAFREKLADIELVCHVINITYQEHRAILERCRPLQEYSFLVKGIEDRRKQGMSLADAIRATMQYCVKHGIMKEFLLEHWEEVTAMFALQWDEEEEKKVLYGEAHEAGRKEGRKEGREEGREEGRKEGRKEGHQEGREEGEDRSAKLMMALFAAGRAQDAQRAAKNPAFRKQLFHEFHID